MNPLLKPIPRDTNYVCSKQLLEWYSMLIVTRFKEVYDLKKQSVTAYYFGDVRFSDKHEYVIAHGGIESIRIYKSEKPNE